MRRCIPTMKKCNEVAVLSHYQSASPPGIVQAVAPNERRRWFFAAASGRLVRSRFRPRGISRAPPCVRRLNPTPGEGEIE